MPTPTVRDLVLHYVLYATKTAGNRKTVTGRDLHQHCRFDRSQQRPAGLVGILRPKTLDQIVQFQETVVGRARGIRAACW